VLGETGLTVQQCTESFFTPAAIKSKEKAAAAIKPTSIAGVARQLAVQRHPMLVGSTLAHRRPEATPLVLIATAIRAAKEVPCHGIVVARFCH
jgi:hypothetical protein